MNINVDKIKQLNNISVTTNEAKLGDLLLYILSILDEKKENVVVEQNNTKIDFVPNTEATSIKQLVADYNKLVGAIKASGLMAEE